jgi:endonuclease III
MKLTEEQKQKINAWFESKTEDEVKEIMETYGVENIKERHIGEVFDFYGHKLKVCKSKNDKCEECFLYTNDRCSFGTVTITGFCNKDERTDKNYVIFKEVCNTK